jgi:hypothetical protein
MLESANSASNGLNLSAKLIEYPKIEESIGKSIKLLKSNILTILAL